MQRNPITLTQSGGVHQISEDMVVYTFASGRLEYDCESCQAQCCRGHGFNGQVSAELPALLSMRKALPLFLDGTWGASDGRFKVANAPPECFFLSDDGRCEVHAKFGLDGKPETCRLFPFNFLRRIKGHLLVSPHLSLCPLTVSDSPVRSPFSTYEKLSEQMALRGVSSRVQEVSVSGVRVERAIGLERSIVTASERFLDCDNYLAFAKEQAHLTLDAGPIPELKENYLQSLNIIQDFLSQLSPSHQLYNDPFRKTVLRQLVGSTGTLRSLRQFYPADEEMRLVRLQQQHRIPQMMLVYSHLLLQAVNAGMKKMNFRTICSLERELRPLTELLSIVDENVAFLPDCPIDLNPIDDGQQRRAYVAICRALLPRNQRQSPVSLGELLLNYAPRDPVAQILFLKNVARRLSGRLVPVRTLRTSRAMLNWRTRLRSAIQQRVLGALEGLELEAVYTQLAALGR